MLFIIEYVKIIKKNTNGTKLLMNTFSKNLIFEF